MRARTPDAPGHDRQTARFGKRRWGTPAGKLAGSAKNVLEAVQPTGAGVGAIGSAGRRSGVEKRRELCARAVCLPHRLKEADQSSDCSPFFWVFTHWPKFL